MSSPPRSAESTSPPRDDLAVPIDFAARRGAGSTRSLVLGGGGVYFIAWQLGLHAGLVSSGIDLGSADTVIGTSAGAMMGALLRTGRISLFARSVGTLLTIPQFTALFGSGASSPSAERAYRLSQLSDGSPGAVRHVGHASLAAVIPHPQGIRRTLTAMVGRRWPRRPFLVTATDCFSGERLVLRRGDTGLDRAVAASICVPGVFAPQRIGDRFCMDGGVVGTATHGDLASGADHVIVTSLATDLTTPEQAAVRTAEIAALHDSGSQVTHIALSGVRDDILMDPRAVPEAIAAGRLAAATWAPMIDAAWSVPAPTPSR